MPGQFDIGHACSLHISLCPPIARIVSSRYAISKSRAAACALPQYSHPGRAPSAFRAISVAHTKTRMHEAQRWQLPVPPPGLASAPVHA